MDNRVSRAPVPEAGARDPGVGGRCPPRPPSRACGRRLLLCPRVAVLGACPRWTWGHPRDPIYLNRPFKGPVSKPSHALGCWGSELQHTNLGLGHRGTDNPDRHRTSHSPAPTHPHVPPAPSRPQPGHPGSEIPPPSPSAGRGAASGRADPGVRVNVGRSALRADGPLPSGRRRSSDGVNAVLTDVVRLGHLPLASGAPAVAEAP